MCQAQGLWWWQAGKAWKAQHKRGFSVQWRLQPAAASQLTWHHFSGYMLRREGVRPKLRQSDLLFWISESWGKPQGQKAVKIKSLTWWQRDGLWLVPLRPSELGLLVPATPWLPCNSFTQVNPLNPLKDSMWLGITLISSPHFNRWRNRSTDS